MTPPRDEKLASTERFMMGGVAVFAGVATAVVQALSGPRSAGRMLLLVLLFVVVPALFGARTLARSRARQGVGSRAIAGAVAILVAGSLGVFYVVLLWSAGRP